MGGKCNRGSFGLFFTTFLKQTEALEPGGAQDRTCNQIKRTWRENQALAPLFLLW